MTTLTHTMPAHWLLEGPDWEESGYIPLKQFVHETAMRERIRPLTVYMRVSRGQYNLQIIRKNKRNILVRVKQ